MANQAAFTINGTPSEDPVTGDRAFVALNGALLSVTLEVNPSLALRATFEVFDITDGESPLASKNAPVITWVENGLAKITLGPVPTGINDTVTINMPAVPAPPATGINTYLFRCTVATPGDGSPGSQEQVFERAVLIFGTLSVPPLRKTFPAESTEARARGWSDSLNDMIDALDNALGVIGGNLQAAYTAGNTINVTAANGPLLFRGFAAENTSPLTVEMDAVPVLAVDGAGAVTISPIAGQELTLGLAGDTTRTLGDFVVEGTTFTVDSETVLMKDNHLYLNAGYEIVAAQTAGLVGNYLPIATTDTVAATGFVAGVATVSNPTVNTVGSVFSVGQLIQITGANEPSNNGLFEVLSDVAGLLTIRGVGTTATVEDFTQNQFVTDTTVAGTIIRLNVGVIRIGIDGIPETAKGSATGFIFDDLVTTSGLSLQASYDAGNTIVVVAADGPVALSNSADGTDLISLSRTFAGVGRGIAIIMAAATLGDGIFIEHNQTTTGNAIHVVVDAAATTAGGILVVHNGSGGSALEVQNAVAAMLQINADGTILIDGNSDGVVQITSQGTGTMSVAALGSGDLGLQAVGSGNVNVNAQGGGALNLQEGGVDRIVIAADGSIDVTPASGQSFNVNVIGAGDAILTTVDGQAKLESLGTGSADIESNTSIAISATTEVSIDTGATFDLTYNVRGGSFTLNQTGDVSIAEVGAGEVLEGATSIIGAVNRLARNRLVISDYVPGASTNTGTFPGGAAQKATITIPAEDNTFIITAKALVSHSNTSGDPSCRLQNITDAVTLGTRNWISEMKSSANIMSCQLEVEFVQTVAAGAKQIDLEFAKDSGGGTMTISDARLSAVRKFT